MVTQAPEIDASPRSTGGLRRRKQARARLAIQRAALDLAESRGYSTVTVDDICTAAEVSRSTFFRQFGTKASVFEADLPAEGAEDVLARESEFTLERLAVLVGHRYRSMDESLYQLERRRLALLQTVPELRSSFAAELMRPLAFLLDYVARMLDSSTSNADVRVLAGALLGAVLATQVPVDDGSIETPASGAKAAEQLEDALRRFSDLLRPEVTEGKVRHA